MEECIYNPAYDERQSCEVYRSERRYDERQRRANTCQCLSGGRRDGCSDEQYGKQPTEPGGNEEAPDVQDPCKDLIELRLKKVWKRDEEKDRPNEVIFNITRSYEKDGKPVVDTNFNKEVILTKKDAQTSDIWEKVLTGAEYTAYHVGTDGKKYYYTYHVSEMKVDGYTTEITYKGDRQYSITVTNTKNWFDSLLPETGGMGKALLYTLGVLLLCLVTATEYRKRKSTRSQSSYK